MLKILYYVKTTNTQIHRKAQHRNPTATMMQCSWDVGWATDVELFLSFILHKEKLMGICVCALMSWQGEEGEKEGGSRRENKK